MAVPFKEPGLFLPLKIGNIGSDGPVSSQPIDIWTEKEASSSAQEIIPQPSCALGPFLILFPFRGAQ
jgi:hypothetical protein